MIVYLTFGLLRLNSAFIDDISFEDISIEFCTDNISGNTIDYALTLSLT